MWTTDIFMPICISKVKNILLLTHLIVSYSKPSPNQYAYCISTISTFYLAQNKNNFTITVRRHDHHVRQMKVRAAPFKRITAQKSISNLTCEQITFLWLWKDVKLSSFCRKNAMRVRETSGFLVGCGWGNARVRLEVFTYSLYYTTWNVSMSV